MKFNKFINLIFCAYLIMALLRFVIPENLILTSGVALIGIFLFVYYINLKQKNTSKIIIFFFIFVISTIISAILNNRFERLYQNVIFIIINAGVVLAIINADLRSKNVKIIFYLLCAIFIAAIILNINPDEILKVASYNGISMLLLYACLTYYILYIKERNNNVQMQKIPVFPAMLVFIISIWAIGRGGILSSLFLVIAILIHNYKIKIFNINLNVILILLIPLYMYIFFEDIISYLSNFGFFKGATQLIITRINSEAGEARLSIWSNYLNNIDIIRILIGVNMYTDPWNEGNILQYNYHNLFINLHAYTGVFMALFVMLMINAGIKYFNKKSAYLIILITIIVRGMTDQFLFFETFDYLIIVLLVIPLVKKNNLIRN